MRYCVELTREQALQTYVSIRLSPCLGVDPPIGYKLLAKTIFRTSDVAFRMKAKEFLKMAIEGLSVCGVEKQLLLGAFDSLGIGFRDHLDSI